MNPEISVIVPIYNVEPYLSRCIDSILSQIFKNFELILVDDGSPDRCPEICDEYANKDDRVRVIHKNNGGISDTRNAGLDIAQGKYISFIDSDDCIHPQMLSCLYEALTLNNADIAVCNYAQFSVNIPENQTIQRPLPIEIKNSDEILSEFFKNLQWWFGASLCTKLFDRKIFEDLRFPKAYIYEDSYTQTDILNLADKVVKVDADLYFYYHRNGSIMRSNHSEKCFISGLALAKHNLSFFIDHAVYNQTEKAYEAYAEQYIKQKLAVFFCKEKFPTLEEDHFFKANRKHLLCSDQICKMKKLVMLLLFISPKTALQLCRKYFPECLYDFMR